MCLLDPFKATEPCFSVIPRLTVGIKLASAGTDLLQFELLCRLAKSVEMGLNPGQQVALLAGRALFHTIEYELQHFFGQLAILKTGGSCAQHRKENRSKLGRTLCQVGESMENVAHAVVEQ